MASINKQVTISDKDKLFFQAELIAGNDGRVFTLRLLCNELNLPDIEGWDFFDCLLKLRLLLEQKQLFILCQGAVRFVGHSGMSRSMSDGMKAYLLKPGEKASMSHLVEIFDPAPVEAVSSVAEQAAFFKQWISSAKY